MAGKKIGELTPLGRNLIATDELELSLAGSAGSRKITGAQIIGAAGGVSSVTGTSPIISSGGTTPTISIATATTSTTGALTSTDWNTFNSKAAVNPTSTQMPYNNGGVFADSGIEVLAATSPVPNKSYAISSALTSSGSALFISPFVGAYSFGDASATSFPISAPGGAAFTGFGSMVMGCGISNPAFGVFNADGASGLTRMGNSAATSIGVDMAGGAMYIGSYFSLFGSPTNPTTPVKWVSVVDESSNTYYLPLYQ